MMKSWRFTLADSRDSGACGKQLTCGKLIIEVNPGIVPVDLTDSHDAFPHRPLAQESSFRSPLYTYNYVINRDINTRTFKPATP